MTQGVPAGRGFSVAENTIITDSTPIELAWVDFETTGLEDYPGVVPLELGIKLTDRWGRVKGEYRSLIMEPNWRNSLDGAAKVVQDMHDKSGLRADLEKAEAMMPADGPNPWGEVLNAREVDMQVFEFLHEVGGAVGIIPMAGSTINFDRFFMRTFMPTAHGWFHYRNVDVTTLKNLCRMLNPSVYSAVPQTPVDQKWHRPMQDLAGSIEEYNFYRQNFLFEG